MPDSPNSAADAISIDLASVDEVLGTARSVRRKLDFERAIPQSVLYDCIDLATQAPIGLGGENWRFVVVEAAEQKLAIANIYRSVLDDLQQQRGLTLKPTQTALADRLHEMPAMVLVCVEGVPEPEVHSQVAFYGSILPAAWSLMLALRARGIGCTWTSLLSSQQQAVAEVLGIPATVTQTVMLPIGYCKGAKLRPAARQAAPQVTYWNRWGRQEKV